MPMEVLFAGVRVRDLEVASDWYGRLFGRAADIAPNDKEVMWRVADGGWLYVLQEPSSAGTSLVTIAVADLDAEVADSGWIGATASFDPGRRCHAASCDCGPKIARPAAEPRVR